MIRVRSKDRVIGLALIVSVLFHLSMVTLFRIVIYFPREDIPYYDFRIVEARSTPVFAEGYRELSVPDSGNALERLASAESPDDAIVPGLPPIELPTVRFAEMDLLRMERRSLETRSRYNELFESGPQDTWAQFGQRLSSVGSRIFGEEASPRGPRLVPVSQPAPGFAAYLEWMNEPMDRQPLSVARIDALWGLDPEVLEGSVVFLFRVNREGRVTFIQAPLDDAAGIVDSAAAALLRYRFEPLPDSGPDVQHGTFIVRAAEVRP